MRRRSLSCVLITWPVLSLLLCGCPSKEKAPEPQQRTIRDHAKASEAIKEQLPPGSLPPGQAGAVRAIQKGLENAERRHEGRARAAEAEAGQAP